MWPGLNGSVELTCRPAKPTQVGVVNTKETPAMRSPSQITSKYAGSGEHLPPRRAQLARMQPRHFRCSYESLQAHTKSSLAEHHGRQVSSLKPRRTRWDGEAGVGGCIEQLGVRHLSALPVEVLWCQREPATWKCTAHTNKSWTSELCCSSGITSISASASIGWT